MNPFGWFRKKPKPPTPPATPSLISDLWSQEIEYAANNVRGIVDFIAAVDPFDMPLTKIAWPKIVHPKPWQFAWWRWKFVWARDRAVDTFLVLIGRREARKHWEGDDY
jgi:hypothetical protein